MSVRKHLEQRRSANRVRLARERKGAIYAYVLDMSPIIIYEVRRGYDDPQTIGVKEL